MNRHLSPGQLLIPPRIIRQATMCVNIYASVSSHRTKLYDASIQAGRNSGGLYRGSAAGGRRLVHMAPGVVGAAHQRAGLDMAEAEFFRFHLELLKLIGGNIAIHGKLIQ